MITDLKPDMRVSVIIPTYNTKPDFLAKALESVFNQTYPHIEVLVVDDNSNPDIRKNYVIPKTARLIQREQQGGAAAARNTALREATGDLITFLDADDIWFPEKIKKQVQILKDNPDIGLTYCPPIVTDENLIPLKKQPLHKLVNGDVFPQMFHVCCIPTPCGVMLRKEVLDKTGLFDESFSKGGEDWDLWLRIARTTRFQVAPDSH